MKIRHNVLGRGLLSGASAAGMFFLGALSPWTDARADDGLTVLASFGIIEDITRNVAGDKAKVKVIVPVGSDPHAYNLTAANMIDMEKSDLIIINGLSFEGYLERYLTQDKYAKKIVVASDGIEKLAFMEEHQSEHDHDADHDHDAAHDHDAEHEHNDVHEHRAHRHHHHHHGGTDPHAWQNPLNGALYAQNIADALCKADAGNCQFFKKRAADYISELKSLDAKYRSELSSIPKENRVIITTHDAFGYLARHYDLRILSPFGLSTGSEPSAKRIAELKDIISRGVVKAVFMEKNGNNTILDQLAGDRKIKNVELYADTLAPEGECSTYVGILNHNLDAIVGAISVSGK